MLAFAAALALPASASTSALADDREAFARSFTDISTPIARQAPAAGAVDITAIIAAEEPAPAEDGTPIASGVASYYGKQFHGRRTASGERFDMTQLTAAHRTLPFGSRVKVTNPSNGKSVVVRINDRGPFHGGRVIDLSRSAASSLGLIARGSGRVELALLD